MSRNYVRGVYPTRTLVKLNQSTGANQYLQADGILVNGFSDLRLFTDDAGSVEIDAADFNETTVDVNWTGYEVGYSNKTVYSQYQITNAAYYNIDIWGTYSDFGTFTDADAPFTRIGVVQELAASATVELLPGAMVTIIESDTNAGNNTLTIPVPDFIGKKVITYSIDTGLTYVKGVGSLTDSRRSGIYSGASDTGTPISEGLKLELTAISLTEWLPTNEVTANYISGEYNLQFRPDGDYLLNYIKATEATASTAEGAVFRGSDSLAFPVSFASTAFKSLSISVAMGAGSDICWGGDSRLSIATTSSMVIDFFSGVSGRLTRPAVTIRGDY